MSSFPALTAGVAVSILMLVLLLSLVGGVMIVVVATKKMETGQSHCKPEENQHDGEANINMYQNVQSEPTPASGHSEPGYATAADAFINPASAIASFKTHMCEYANEIDQEPTVIGGGGVYEEARVEWGIGGNYEEPMKGESKKQKIFDAKKVLKPEDLYAEPNKVKKKDAKKDTQVNRYEEGVAPSDNLYAKPDMAKKKDQTGQQDVEQGRKFPPQAPLPYLKHKEAKHEIEEDGEGAPELPPPYVPDEEQHYNTGDGNGSSSMDRKFEYAVLDWHKK